MSMGGFSGFCSIITQGVFNIAETCFSLNYALIKYVMLMNNYSRRLEKYKKHCFYYNN